MARNSLKKHDATAESRASKARRQRTTTQIRKDKRRAAVQSKRRRVMSQEDVPLTGRDIGELVRILTDATATASHQERYEVLKEIRVSLATHENDYETVEKIIESGIVPVLVELLGQASPLATATRTGGEVYKEILWCLTNIASGQYEHTKLVLPAVPRLLQLLDGANPTLAEHAAWVLGNIAADCEEFRQQLIAQGTVAPLVKQLSATTSESTAVSLATTCAWALSNIARGHETSAEAFVQAGIVPVVLQGLPRGSPSAFAEATLVELAWLLSFLTAREEEYLRLWLENGLVEALLPFLETTNELLLTPVLRVFGNICCGALDHHTDEWQLPYIHRVLAGESLFLQRLLAFLQPETANEHPPLAAESAWVISNLATLEASVVDLLVRSGVLPLLAQQFHHGAFEVRREVAFALTNMALTSASLLEQVLALEVLPGFLQLLTAADIAVVGNSLRLVENVLRVAPRGVALVEGIGGIDALETVQFQSQEPHLASWAEALVNEFYGENYGINSPPSGGMAGFGDATFAPVQLSPSDPTQTEAVPGGIGRGRGAHMTTPAWKK